MRSNTSVRESTSDVGHMARGAATGKWMSLLARLGYAAKGLVYVIIGFLAVELAIGHGGSATDQRGALQTINAQPFGNVLLIIVAIGLIGFALWSLIQAIFDTEGKGRKAKGVVERIGYAVVGVIYGVLAYGAFQIITGSGSGGKGSTATAQDWTALLLKHSYGVALVVIGGLIFIVIAFYLFQKAYTARFMQRFNLATASAAIRKLVKFMGRLGYGALGVVMGIVGIFLIVAAVQHNPHEAKGLDTALKTLAHQPFGPLLLGIVALGLIAYGVYSFLEARYRRVGRG